MLPKTKLQKKVFEIQKQAPGITEAQVNWASEKCLGHHAVRLKSGKITCLDCAHSWTDKTPLLSILKPVCPGCGRNVTLKDTRTKVFKDGAYFNIITTFQGYQIIKVVRIVGRYHAGKPADIVKYKVGEMWITPEGKHVIFGYIAGGSYYCDQWSGEYTLRHNNAYHSYNFGAYKTYPKIVVIPEIKRAGFKKNFHGILPFNFFKAILSDVKFETLLKAEQFGLFKYFNTYRTTHPIAECWPAIKICIRNNYIISEGNASVWADHLQLLKFFNKDLRNVQYVCPQNLLSEHGKYVAKKRKIEQRETLRKQREKAEEQQKEYISNMQRFFGLEFSAAGIVIKVLESVHEFIEEGDKLKHCVYTNKYYARPDSLILSARINDMPVETVEVSLSQMKVVQARGHLNKKTQYHEQIVSLVQQHLPVIRKLNKNKDKVSPLHEFDNLNVA